MTRMRMVLIGATAAFALGVGLLVVAQRHGGGGGDTGQTAAQAAIERCRSLVRENAAPSANPQVLADCAALLRGNPLELQSLLNQAAALDALSRTTSSAVDDTTTTRLHTVAARRDASTSSTGTSPSTSEDTTSTTNPPPTQPPCTAPTPLLCGVLPEANP